MRHPNLAKLGTLRSTTATESGRCDLYRGSTLINTRWVQCKIFCAFYRSKKDGAYTFIKGTNFPEKTQE